MTEIRAGEASPKSQEEQGAPPRGLGVAALAEDALIYGGARVLLKSLAFLLVPLYAHFLAPADFGVLELVLAIVAFIDVLIAANMDGVFARFYFERHDAAWRRQIITLYLLIESLYPAVVIGAVILFSGTLSDRVFGTDQYVGFLVIALVDLYLTNIVDLPMILCRVRRKPMTFARYALARGLIQVVFSVLLVAVWHLGVKGILIASLISVCAAFVFTAREWIHDLSRNISPQVGREMIAFAWPGLIGGLSFFALNLMDRFFIKHYHGLAANGLYGTAFRYSQIVFVGVMAFRMGWTQWHYSWLHTERHRSMVARGANYYFFATGFLAVLVSAWILPLFHLVMPRAYWPATDAVAPLALASVGAGAYTIFIVGLNVTKRMRLTAPLAMLGGAIAIGLYFLLIPPYSYRGAAWATALAFASLALLVLAVGQRIYPVPWQWRRILLAVGLAVGLALTSLAVDHGLGIAVSIPARLAITLAYPAALFALGFFPRDDIASARGRLRALLRR